MTLSNKINKAEVVAVRDLLFCWLNNGDSINVQVSSVSLTRGEQIKQLWYPQVGLYNFVVARVDWRDLLVVLDIHIHYPLLEPGLGPDQIVNNTKLLQANFSTRVVLIVGNSETLTNSVVRKPHPASQHSSKGLSSVSGRIAISIPQVLFSEIVQLFLQQWSEDQFFIWLRPDQTRSSPLISSLLAGKWEWPAISADQLSRCSQVRSAEVLRLQFIPISRIRVNHLC